MAGQPFTPTQILWINFLIDAPIGVALGFDKETPGLMLLTPRRRDASILTRGVLITAGLVGLFSAVSLLLLMSYGVNHYGSAAIASSMGIVAFGFFGIVGCFENRNQTASVITTSTFNSPQMNRIVLFEAILAVFVVETHLFNMFLGTASMSLTQWGLSLAPAGVLFVLWELGKLIARRVEGGGASEAAGSAAPVTPPPVAGDVAA